MKAHGRAAAAFGELSRRRVARAFRKARADDLGKPTKRTRIVEISHRPIGRDFPISGRGRSLDVGAPGRVRCRHASMSLRRTSEGKKAGNNIFVVFRFFRPRSERSRTQCGFPGRGEGSSSKVHDGFFTVGSSASQNPTRTFARKGRAPDRISGRARAAAGDARREIGRPPLDETRRPNQKTDDERAKGRRKARKTRFSRESPNT